MRLPLWLMFLLGRPAVVFHPVHHVGDIVNAYVSDASGEWEELHDLGWPGAVAVLDWRGPRPPPRTCASPIWRSTFEILSVERPARWDYPPFWQRAHYTFARYGVEMREARPTMWPGASTDSTPAHTGGGVQPFTGSLIVGAAYEARLRWKDLESTGPIPILGSGDDSVVASPPRTRWAIEDMDEPEAVAGDTLRWLNPEELPGRPQGDDTIEVTFHVTRYSFEPRLVGVLLPESQGGITVGFPHWYAHVDRVVIAN